MNETRQKIANLWNTAAAAKRDPDFTSHFGACATCNLASFSAAKGFKVTIFAFCQAYQRNLASFPDLCEAYETDK